MALCGSGAAQPIWAEWRLPEQGRPGPAITEGADRRYDAAIRDALCCEEDSPGYPRGNPGITGAGMNIPATPGVYPGHRPGYTWCTHHPVPAAGYTPWQRGVPGWCSGLSQAGWPDWRRSSEALASEGRRLAGQLQELARPASYWIPRIG